MAEAICLLMVEDVGLTMQIKTPSDENISVIQYIIYWYNYDEKIHVQISWQDLILDNTAVPWSNWNLSKLNKLNVTPRFRYLFLNLFY